VSRAPKPRTLASAPTRTVGSFARTRGWEQGVSRARALTALGIGVLGYHHFGGLAWLDALENASMILGGMGPVSEMRSEAGKLFASAYALFSGLVFIGIMGIVLAPVAHRVLHAFHLEEDEEPS
jgi:hypothetical protein